jgi:hypothetical protein
MNLRFLPAGLSAKAVLPNLMLFPREFLHFCVRPSHLAPDDLADLNALTTWLSGANRHPSNHNKVLLLASLLPLPYAFKIEMVVALAMRQRGYQVVVLTNLASYPLVKAYHGDVNGCEIHVLEDYLRMGNARGFTAQISDLLSSGGDLLQRIKDFRYREAYTGLHALATLSSAVTDGKILVSAEGRGRLKRTLKRSMHLTDAAATVVDRIRPDVILSIEKGFVGTAEIFYAALNASIDYVQWVGCHEPDSIMLKRYSWANFREHPFSTSDVGWQRILDLPWSDRYRDGVMAHFTRGYQEGSWYRYKSLATDLKQVTKQDLLAQLGLDPGKKTAVIYSHILNDANLFYGQDLFSGGYEEWLVETVRAAAENPHVNWVLKLHPSNVYRNAKLGYSGEYGEILALKHAFGKVPDFLRVVYPDEKASPFSFFQITDFGVTVRGTVGLELPCFGVPVLTAGTGRYAGKGFTVDSDTSEAYLEKIKAIQEISPLSEEQTRRGQRYAYFMFRARPARYGNMFSDVYNYPLSHARYRDIALGEKPLNVLLNHPQLQKITHFLCIDEDDFLDLSTA